MSSLRSLDVEKKAEAPDATSREQQAASLSRRPRRSLLPWLAFLALGLLVFAGGRRAVCGRSSNYKQGIAVSNAPVDDAGAKEERLQTAMHLAMTDHLAVEPTPVLRRQASSTSSAAASPTVLECFQVAPPVLTPDGASYQATESDGSEVFLDAGNSASTESCTVLLMEHSFAWSYGMPFIGKRNRTYRFMAAILHTC